MGGRLRTLMATMATLAVALAVVPVAAAEAGGAPYSAAPSSGGAEYGALLKSAAPPQPIARAFRVTPARVTAPRLPAIRLEVDQPSARTVRARLVFWPQRSGKITRLDLGSVPAGRVVTVHWPKRFTVAPGSYRVRLHVKGRGGQVLARRAAAGDDGLANLVVVPKPAPARPPAPVAIPAPVTTTAPAPSGAGVFPVRGPHVYGDGFGAGRVGHVHQGQDIPAAEGVPVVAPLSGTVASTSYQAAGAGYYVVENADDGRALFFAHCRAGSFTVATGQRVAAGAQLCQVGSTGDSTGPHLHFEIWLGGWRTSAASHPIDPLPQLRAWDG